MWLGGEKRKLTDKEDVCYGDNSHEAMGRYEERSTCIGSFSMSE